MTDLSSKTILVRDGGFFIGFARRLAKDFGRVIYCPEGRQNNPSFNEGIIGRGFDNLTHCSDLWLAKDQADVFAFPDVGFLGEQIELRSQGFPVWGAGMSMRLEMDREFFLGKLEEFGLDVPPHEIIEGVSALGEFLAAKQDIYIKVSKWRATWETYHWRSFREDGHMLDVWAVRFGGAKELIRFLCFYEIETTLEIGGDGICIDGQWPDEMLHGIEKKDEAYFSAVTKRAEMPEQLVAIMDAFAPFFKETEMRSQLSMEVRVADKKAFFIDATQRGGLPSTASFLKSKNVSEVIYAGAHGELVPIEFDYKFSAECMVKIKSAEGAWGTIVLPDELIDNLIPSDCCEIDGQLWFPSDDKAIEEIGWLRATGNTPTEVAKEMNRLADLLPDGADAAVESLADIIREIEDEQDKGIQFTEQEMPPAEIVLEKS